jgi:hypothetical protein
MKQNIGKLDKNLRLIVGLAVMVLGLYTQSWWGLIGLVLAGTSAMGSCPIYTALGLSSKK